jgi:hypothetical protein
MEQWKRQFKFRVVSRTVGAAIRTNHGDTAVVDVEHSDAEKPEEPEDVDSN